MENLTTTTFKTKIFDFENEKEWKFLGDKPCIIDCYADWCGPCKMLTPILDDLNKQYGDKVNFYKINTESESELAALLSIRSIPTMFFIPVGGQPHMANGLLPKLTIEKIIKDTLNV